MGIYSHKLRLLDYKSIREINESRSSNIKNIIFDFGDVLVFHNREFIYNYYETVLKPVGFTKDELEKFCKGYFEFCHNHENETDIYNKYRKSVDRKWYQFYDELIRYCTNMAYLADYSKDLLISLYDKGYKLYYLSNQSKWNWINSISKVVDPIMPYFEGGIIDCNVGVSKPDKAIYKLLLATYDLVPEECLFIDDKQKNIDGAKSCKMKAKVFDSKCLKYLQNMKAISSINETVECYSNSTKFFDFIDINKLRRYKMIIVGEVHSRNMIGIYDKLLKELKPDYFICEFADTDRCMTREELKDRMDNATDGATSGVGADYQYNYWCYRLAYEHNVPLIGCNKVSRRYNKMDDEDKERENYMLKVLKEFENKGTCLVQLGDHHLRSIPISKEFADYCGDTKDDRGVVDDITVSFESPVWKYFKNKSNAIIIRPEDEYDNEVNFSNGAVNEAASKYDPPMSYDEIVKTHGKQLADRLMKDPIHKWRAETGIELIHKEPTLKELNRIWDNWNLMNSSMKSKSDKKSMEFFGMKNKEHYYKLLSEYESVNESKDVSNVEDGFKKKNGKSFKLIDLNSSEALKYVSDKWRNGKYASIAICKEDDKLAGYVYVNKSGNIAPLEVYKDYRGYGLSELLMRDAIDKYKGYQLGVYSDNEVAIRLYRKLGFVKIGEKKYADGDVVYIMKLRSKLSKNDVIQESSDVKESVETSSEETAIRRNLSHMSTEEIKWFAENKAVSFTFKYKNGNITESTSTGTTKGEKGDIADTRLGEKLAKEEYHSRLSGKSKCEKHIDGIWPTKSIPHKSGAIGIQREYSTDESTNVSTLDSNFKKKDKIKLSNLRMESRQRNDEGKSLVLSWYNDKEFVATVLVDTIPASDGYKWFGSFRVSKKYRGCGLGDQIMDLITSSKYKAGALSVYKDNEVAIKLYKKHGFKISKERTDNEYYFMYLDKNKYKSVNEGYEFDPYTQNHSLYEVAQIVSQYVEKNDSFYNIGKWPTENNILFVTGLSGSGKSTLSLDLKDKYKSNIVNLDYISNYYRLRCKERDSYKNIYDKVYTGYPKAAKFFDIKKPGISYKYTDSFQDEEYYKIIPDFINFIETVGKNDKIIIEGAQLFIVLDNEYFVGKSLIIKNIDYNKSMKRRVDREVSDEDKIKAKKYNEDYYNELKEDMKRIKKLKKFMDSNGVVQEAALSLDDLKPIPKSVKLYHGSPIQGLKTIKPFNDAISKLGKVKVVYATKDKRFAACFGANWRDGIAKQGTWDNWKTVIMGISDKLDTSKPCSLYELENDGSFLEYRDKESVSKNSIKVKKEYKYDTFMDMLKDNGVKVISYDNYMSNVGNSNPKFDYIDEATIMNQKDILYNKDKFDNGEINLCIIIGLSGSGKSTMALNTPDTVEKFGLDDVIENYRFTDDEMKEYGALISSFFLKNKQYRFHSRDEFINQRTEDPEHFDEDYDTHITNDFINYAISYSKSHKNIKYILEGVWPVYYCNPEQFKNYAVYIKGTSLLISRWRAAKRDSGDAPNNKEKIKARIQNFTSKQLWKNNKDFDKKLDKWRNYFKRLEQ